MEQEKLGPAIVRHLELERIAHTALAPGRIMMECGASVAVVHAAVERIAKAFGVEVLGIRAGHGSLEITLHDRGHTITRMVAVGRLGVNHRLDQAVQGLTTHVSKGGMALEDIDAEVARLVKETPHHSPLVVAIAVGIACASFGRLLGIDWTASGAVLIAGTIGQYTRHQLAQRGVNVFLVAAIIAFLSATLGGAGSILFQSKTTNLAMIASTLLLVPGVPSTNAQTDIMDGYPTMGIASAVWVFMIMVFASVGIWFAEALLGLRS